MKSVFNKIEKKKSKEIVFPVLAESVRNGFVVLFLSRTEGVVVKGNLSNTTGAYRNCFLAVDDLSTWRILSPEESIVLSNDWWVINERLSDN